MSIRTKQSLAGFVATDPELTLTNNGDARVYMRVGQPQARFEQDGTFTQLDPEFTDLEMFRKSAELAHEQFRKGDNFIAEGEIRKYTGGRHGAGAVRRFPDRPRQQHHPLHRRPRSTRTRGTAARGPWPGTDAAGARAA